MSGKPFQSKLLPHLDFIRECRAQRMSYPRLAAELHMRFGLKTAPANIHSFVKVRARRHAVYTLPPPEPVKVASAFRHSAPSAFLGSSRDGWQLHDSTKPLEKDPA